MKKTRFLLIIVAILTNYFVIEVHFIGLKSGPSSMLGVVIYQMGYWIAGTIIAIIIAAWHGFEHLKKIDYLFIALTTPLIFILLFGFLKLFGFH